MFKKFLATAAALLLGAGLSVVAVAAPASATSYPTGPDANHEQNWQLLPGETCIKIEPVNTVPYTLGSPPAGRLWSKVVVKAGSGPAANTVFTSGLVAGAKFQHATKDSISHLILCSIPAPQTQTDSVDCSVIKYVKGSPLAGDDYINLTLIQNGQSFQMNAEINEVQAQDAAVDSPSHLYVLVKTPNGDVKYPLTIAERDSGVWTYSYSSYLVGEWTVDWIQYASHNVHFEGELSCGEPVYEAAAALTTTGANCDAGEQLVLGVVDHAAWGAISYSGSSYSVTATAASGYRFPAGEFVAADGKTKTFTGTLAPKKTGAECVTTPDCIPASAVSYSYDPLTNGGEIVVAQVDSKSGELCKPFWVTATSWKFTGEGVWPQTRDVVDYVNDDETGKHSISKPGTYPYVAPFECGQGDIYASFVSQPEPGTDLYGPDDPFDEVFLHEMGFTGPNPTWTVDEPGCNEATPVAPAVTVVSECGVPGTVTPVPSDGVSYAVEFDPATGAYTVTATPLPNWYFANDDDQVIVYEDTVGAQYDCVTEPDASIAYGECMYDSDGTADQRKVELTFDNTASSKPVEFVVSYFPEFTKTVPAGQKVSFEVSPIWPAGGGYEVTAAGKVFDLQIAACDEPTQPEPKTRIVTDDTVNCEAKLVTVTTTTYTTPYFFNLSTLQWELGEETAGAPVFTTRPLTQDEISDHCGILLDTDPKASSCTAYDVNSPFDTFIMVGLEDHVIYTISDSDPLTDDIVATSKYTELPIGTYTVTAKAEDGWLLKPDAEQSWVYTVADQSKCDFEPPVLGLATPTLSITQPTCTTDGSYTLGEVEAQPLLWTVGAKSGVTNGTYPAPVEGGTLTFTAANADPTGGLQDWTNPQERTFQPKPSAAACAELPTLAFTGAGGGLTLGLIAALLVGAGIVFVVIRRRFAAE